MTNHQRNHFLITTTKHAYSFQCFAHTNKLQLQYQPLFLLGQNPLHPPTLVANRDALSLRDDSFITANLIDYMLEMALRERPEYMPPITVIAGRFSIHNEQIKSESY